MSLDFDSARLPNEFETEEHHEWRRHLRRFFDKEVRPFAEEWDECGDMPDDLWTKSAAMGILGSVIRRNSAVPRKALISGTLTS